MAAFLTPAATARSRAWNRRRQSARQRGAPRPAFLNLRSPRLRRGCFAQTPEGHHHEHSRRHCPNQQSWRRRGLTPTGRFQHFGRPDRLLSRIQERLEPREVCAGTRGVVRQVHRMPLRERCVCRGDPSSKRASERPTLAGAGHRPPSIGGGAATDSRRFQQPAEAGSLHPDRPDVGLLEIFRLHVLVLIGSRSFPCHEHQRPKVSNVDLVTTSIVDRFID